MKARGVAGAVAVAAVLVVAGCGSEGDKTSGGLSTADESTFVKVFRSTEKVSAAQTKAVRALEQGNVTGARPAVDRLKMAISEARDQTRDFEGHEVRRLFQGYVAPLGGYGAALDRAVSHLERQRDTGAAPSDAVTNADLKGIRAATEKITPGRRRLLKGIRGVTSPEQRKRLRAQLGRLLGRSK